LYIKLAASVDDATSSHQAYDQEHEEEHKEQTGKQLGDREGRAGDAREAEQRGKDADHQKNKGHVQHDVKPPIAVYPRNVHAVCETRAGYTDEAK
jgi:hypothetical protein